MPRNLEHMEKTCSEIASVIGRAVEQQHGKNQVGFALLLFDFGAGGHLTYVSNAEREDMIKALHECAASLSAGGEGKNAG
jgi:hypothetical protein